MSRAQAANEPGSTANASIVDSSEHPHAGEGMVTTPAETIWFGRQNLDRAG
jgi:uncharacterized Fe-S radical SAM superfamily protein PflX